jgi:outer membrane lipoprotein SlyB
MRHGLLLLASTALLLSGCAQHSKAWDDAYAACQAQAIEQSENAGVPDDQRAGWEDNYINSCMQQKGLKA